jgi:uncharacterized membrane protein YqjE
VNNSMEPIEARNLMNMLVITRFSKRNRLSAVNLFVCLFVCLVCLFFGWLVG